MTRPASLYRKVLGASFAQLPPALRYLHDLSVSTEFSGDAEVIAATHPLGRLIARLTGFPTRSCTCRVQVRIDVDGDGETWHRNFGGHRFHSRLSAQDGVLREHLGPHRIRFRLQVDDISLQMHPIHWRTFGVPLPRLLWPRIHARETQADGRFQFDVATAFPLIGTVIHYRGWLVPTPVDP